MIGGFGDVQGAWDTVLRPAVLRRREWREQLRRLIFGTPSRLKRAPVEACVPLGHALQALWQICVGINGMRDTPGPHNRQFGKD